MRIENATLKESLENMDHLISSIRRLRLSLSKVGSNVMLWKIISLTRGIFISILFMVGA